AGARAAPGRTAGESLGADGGPGALWRRGQLFMGLAGGGVHDCGQLRRPDIFAHRSWRSPSTWHGAWLAPLVVQGRGFESGQLARHVERHEAITEPAFAQDVTRLLGRGLDLLPQIGDV